MKKLRRISILLCVLTLVFSTNALAYTMYSLDGRTINIDYNDADTWRNVGWYDNPVTLMYAPDGRTAVVYKSDVAAWEKTGWYDGNKTITIYAPDGRTATIYTHQLQAYKNVGWSEQPVQRKVATYSGTSVPKFESVTGASAAMSSRYNSYSNEWIYTYSGNMIDKLSAYGDYLESIGYTFDDASYNNFWGGFSGSTAIRCLGCYKKGASTVQFWVGNLTWSEFDIFVK